MLFQAKDGITCEVTFNYNETFQWNSIEIETEIEGILRIEYD